MGQGSGGGKRRVGSQREGEGVKRVEGREMKDVGGKEGRGMEGGGREGGSHMSKYRWWRGWGEEQLTRPRMQLERLTHLGKVYTQCTLLQ